MHSRGLADGGGISTSFSQKLVKRKDVNRSRKATATMMQYFIDNNYVQFDLQKIAISAASRGDIEAIKHVQASEPIEFETGFAALNAAKENGHDQCEAFLRDLFKIKQAPVVQRQPGKRQKLTNLTGIDDFEELKAAVFSNDKERAPTNYLKVLKAAFEGKGVIMNYGDPAYFGENDCLRDCELNIEDIESINVWLREIAKINIKRTDGQGSLRAVLNHFKRVLSN